MKNTLYFVAALLVGGLENVFADGDYKASINVKLPLYKFVEDHKSDSMHYLPHVPLFELDQSQDITSGLSPKMFTLGFRATLKRTSGSDVAYSLVGQVYSDGEHIDPIKNSSVSLTAIPGQKMAYGMIHIPGMHTNMLTTLNAPKGQFNVHLYEKKGNAPSTGYAEDTHSHAARDASLQTRASQFPENNVNGFKSNIFGGKNCPVAFILDDELSARTDIDTLMNDIVSEVSNRMHDTYGLSISIGTLIKTRRSSLSNLPGSILEAVGAALKNKEFKFNPADYCLVHHFRNSFPSEDKASRVNGRAQVGTLCQGDEFMNYGYSSWGGREIFEIKRTLMHELSHGLGAEHDSRSCFDPENPFLMGAFAKPSSDHLFQVTGCTLNAIVDNAKGKSLTCLKQGKPVSTPPPAKNVNTTPAPSPVRGSGTCPAYQQYPNGGIIVSRYTQIVTNDQGQQVKRTFTVRKVRLLA